ncbi:hypothetical protein C2L71_00745 [Enteroscipio rubneri]|uniref:Uncharacterized protein n=1 Tax=Enteroscipio rubneri TaxID=2070686 RepID=A0A2K2UEA3_9ACTN|nr:hypothetical protein C2L71_00745 [Enteroscipio rubneri]
MRRLPCPFGGNAPSPSPPPATAVPNEGGSKRNGTGSNDPIPLRFERTTFYGDDDKQRRTRNMLTV